MSDLEYNWPRYPTGPKLHLEALGVISLNFNLYEHSLVIFFEEFFDKTVAAFLFDKLSNVDRAAMIRILMRADPEPEFASEVEYLLRHFAICAENRHSLLHSRLIIEHPTVLTLEKFARGKPENLLEFQLEIGDMRRCADEMHAGFDYVVELWKYLNARKRYHDQLELAQDALAKAPSKADYPSLPKKPPEPRKINPHRPA
jgi:hypothetical protein